jgi:hypothetical protein
MINENENITSSGQNVEPPHQQIIVDSQNESFLSGLTKAGLIIQLAGGGLMILVGLILAILDGLELDIAIEL